MPENRMRERCLILVDEFTESGLDVKRIFNISKNPPITYVVNEIMSNPKYKLA
jgi:hypothetical protein